jgi:hypothetical protein
MGGPLHRSDERSVFRVGRATAVALLVNWRVFASAISAIARSYNAKDMRRLLLTLPFVAPAAAVAGCVTDHGALAEHAPDGRAAPGSADARAMHDGASADAALEASAPPHMEAAPPPPEGTRSLTLVHGVTDSPWVAFCFTVVHDGKSTPLPQPFPEGGLSYGASVRVADGDFADLAADGVASRLVLADSADAVSGLDCASIEDLANQLAVYRSPGDAAADASVVDASTGMDGSMEGGGRDGSVPVAAVRVAPLPSLPPRVLAQARGYVFVAGGCAGGRGVSDPSVQSVCGQSYSPSSPTLTAYVVAPPATAPEGKVALTVLGGTPALTQFDLGFVPALGGDLVTVATRVVSGALRPLSGYTGSSSVGIGAENPASRLQLFAFGSSVPIYDQSWAPTLTAGGVVRIEDGASYTLIVIGPFPGFSARRWWNDPLVTVVWNQ